MAVKFIIYSLSCLIRRGLFKVLWSFCLVSVPGWCWHSCNIHKNQVIPGVQGFLSLQAYLKKIIRALHNLTSEYPNLVCQALLCLPVAQEVQHQAPLYLQDDLLDPAVLLRQLLQDLVRPSLPFHLEINIILIYFQSPRLNSIFTLRANRSNRTLSTR